MTVVVQIERSRSFRSVEVEVVVVVEIGLLRSCMSGARRRDSMGMLLAGSTLVGSIEAREGTEGIEGIDNDRSQSMKGRGSPDTSQVLAMGSTPVVKETV